MNEKQTENNMTKSCIKRVATRGQYYYGGSWHLENLQFLEDFLRKVGVSPTNAGALIGQSPVAVTSWFRVDDVHIAKVYKLIEACGYELRISLFKEAGQRGKAWVRIDKLVENNDNAGVKRLAFLQLALAENGISKVQLARDLGMAPASVQRWFTIDDVFVSYIYKIADMYGLKVNIEIVPAKKNS